MCEVLPFKLHSYSDSTQHPSVFRIEVVYVLKNLLYVCAFIGMPVSVRMQSRRGQSRSPGCDLVDRD